MKKYSIYDLRVLKIKNGVDNVYLICKYGEFNDIYIEIFTNEKIKIEDKSCVTPFSNFYPILARKDYITGKPLTLDKKDLLKKYIEINMAFALEQDEASNHFIL